MALIDQIVEFMSEARKPMHVNDIADAIIKKHPNISNSSEDLAAKVSRILSANVKKKKNALFSKPKNKQGGLKRGMYRLKVSQKRVTRNYRLAEQPSLPTAFTGKAGEHSVLSELLFFGFNASLMTIDDGIDIVASKDSNYFHIQVKTSNATSAGKFRFTIKQKSFNAKDSATTYYILVHRSLENHKYICDHLVIPSSEIRRLIDKAVIKNADSISLTIEKNKSGKFLLNNIEDLSWSLNRYDTIG
jgi:Holliday junction resolvase-like predicted endonuclease